MDISSGMNALGRIGKSYDNRILSSRCSTKKVYLVSKLIVSVVGLSLLSLMPSPANAKTFKYTSATSGSGAQIPVDLDGTHGTNCTTSGGITTCPADSVLSSSGGHSNGGPEPGAFTFQNVSEAVPVTGTGCSFASSSIQACTIGTVTDGCAYTFVGGNAVDRARSSGDLSFSTLVSGTLCINFDTALPWSYVGQQTWAITGGTGQFQGATGSFTSISQGAILQNDPQGHGLAWFTSAENITITTSH